jgi:hypothetical protein
VRAHPAASFSQTLALTPDERTAALGVLDDPPDGLAELRGVLLREHDWRMREGLAQPPSVPARWDAVGSSHRTSTTGGLMRDRLPLILSLTALIVAVLGVTPLG